MRRGMLIDLKRCIGCHACTIACKLEHATPPGVFYTRVLEMEVGKFPSAKRVFLPVLCNHCQDAPCLHACPSGATTQAADGTVLVDKDKCIGCKACIVACPYDARFFLDKLQGYFGDELTPFEKVGYRAHREGTVTKCDFCAERTASGLEPACVQTCPTVARVFGDLDDPLSEVSGLIREHDCFQLRPELGTRPSVYYIP